MFGTAIINHGNWFRLVAPNIVNNANCVTNQILVAPISKPVLSGHPLLGWTPSLWVRGLDHYRANKLVAYKGKIGDKIPHSEITAEQQD